MARALFATPRLSASASANTSLGVTVVLWASYYPVVEHLLAGWDPITLSCARTVIAAFLLAALLVVREGWAALAAPLPWGRLLLLGFCGFAIFMVLTPVGIARAGAAPAALILAMNPALAAVLGRLLYGERIRPETRVAIVFGVTGGALVVVGGDGSLTTPGGGELLVLIANLAWIWYSLAVQRWFPGSTPLRVTALTGLGGAASLIVLTGFTTATDLVPGRLDASAGSLTLVTYSAMSAAGLGWLFWNYGVGRLGIAVASLYGNLVPVAAVVLAVAFGGAVNPVQLGGGAVILAGVLYAQLGRRRLGCAVEAAAASRPLIVLRYRGPFRFNEARGIVHGDMARETRDGRSILPETTGGD